AAGVPRIDAGIDDVANRLLRQRPDRRQHLIDGVRAAGVHERHALWKREDGDIPARRLDHRDVAADFENTDGSLGVNVRLKPDATNVEWGREQQRDDQQPPHQFTSPGNFAVGVGPIHIFSFFRYAGYIVAAPPRVASNGRP